MLSQRGQRSAASQDIPWRFAPAANRYHPKTNPSGVVIFGMAENLLVQEELKKYVQEKVEIGTIDFTYRGSTYGGDRFSAAMAAHLNEYFKPFKPVEPEQILTSAGLTAMHSMLGWSLGDPGDGILLCRPIYGRFELDFVNASGLKMVYADMKGVDPFDEAMVERYQAKLDESNAAGTKIRALLIVNPNNPLGRCFAPETLKALMAFCQKNQIHMINDEIYGLSVYDDNPELTPFTSVLSFDSAGIIDPNLLHVLYGMAKDFGSAGLRLGSLITQNHELSKAMKANFRFHNPGGPSVIIGSTILEDRAFVKNFLALCRTRIKESRDYIVGVLNEAGIDFHRGSNAGFFLYIDLSPWLPKETKSDHPNAREFALAQRLLDAGVGLHPAEEHNDSPGWFRIVFTTERPDLEEGLRRLVNTLGPKPSQ